MKILFPPFNFLFMFHLGALGIQTSCLIFQGIDHFDDIGPCVIMATPGMLQNGLSRELFESWCTDSKNGVIIAGEFSCSWMHLNPKEFYRF